MLAKLTVRQIAEIRAWAADREAALKAIGSVKTKAAALGVSHALVSHVVRHPKYRPTSPELAEQVKRERASRPDFLVVKL